MDKTNRVIKIARRMTEIEEIKANKDLCEFREEELSIEYENLEEELSNIEVS